MNLVNKLVVVALLHVTFVAGELYKDDLCQLKDDRRGVCKIITECPEAIANIRKGIFPQQCGFEGTQVIVCCAEPKPTTPKPTEPPVTQSTTSKPTEPPATKPTTTKPTILPDDKSRAPGEVSNQKCVEYSEYVWKIELNPTLLISGGDIKKKVCPFNRQVLVVGGNPASRREFPHMVQFGYDASSGLLWTCGGSLISDQFVLTAAHCLSDRSLGDAKHARMGIVDLEDDDHMQRYTVVDRIPHPDYEGPAHYNDIGLAKLEKSAELNTWVRPACLYTNPSSPWSNVIASGWGKTDFAGAESTVLLRVILELYDQPKCNKTYKQQSNTNKLMEGIKDDIMICAGHSQELRDTCQGDSGGPLQVYKDGDRQLSCMYNIIGVTSFGKACGLAVNIPGVYTRVSYYIKWIEDIVWPPT